MSMHKTHAHEVRIQEQLKRHGLKADTPSQLADGFRSGYMAAREDYKEAVELLEYTLKAPKDKEFIAAWASKLLTKYKGYTNEPPETEA